MSTEVPTLEKQPAAGASEVRQPGSETGAARPEAERSPEGSRGTEGTKLGAQEQQIVDEIDTSEGSDPDAVLSEIAGESAAVEGSAQERIAEMAAAPVNAEDADAGPAGSQVETNHGADDINGPDGNPGEIRDAVSEGKAPPAESADAVASADGLESVVEPKAETPLVEAADDPTATEADSEALDPDHKPEATPETRIESDEVATDQETAEEAGTTASETDESQEGMKPEEVYAMFEQIMQALNEMSNQRETVIFKLDKMKKENPGLFGAYFSFIMILMKFMQAMVESEEKSR